MFTVAEVAEILTDPEVSETAVFRTYATETYSTSTGKTTRGTKTEHTVTVVTPNADGKVVQRFGAIDGVKEAALFSLVSAQGLTFEPAVGQEFVWDSQTWTVTWVNPIRGPVGVLAYQFGIKGV